MPLIVDHQQRRDEVVRIARELILLKGLEGVTVREVASAAGFSTAVVSHYFRNKKELMFLVFRDTQVAAEKRFLSAIEKKVSLLECLEALLPRDADSTDTWRVWFAFWSMTLIHPEFSDEQKIQARKTQAMIGGLLERQQVPAIDEAERCLQAQQLFAVITGMATQATHDPEGWPIELQRRILRTEIERLTPFYSTSG